MSILKPGTNQERQSVPTLKPGQLNHKKSQGVRSTSEVRPVSSLLLQGWSSQQVCNRLKSIPYICKSNSCNSKLFLAIKINFFNLNQNEHYQFSLTLQVKSWLHEWNHSEIIRRLRESSQPSPLRVKSNQLSAGQILQRLRWDQSHLYSWWMIFTPGLQ